MRSFTATELRREAALSAPAVSRSLFPEKPTHIRDAACLVL